MAKKDTKDAQNGSAIGIGLAGSQRKSEEKSEGTEKVEEVKTAEEPKTKEPKTEVPETQEQETKESPASPTQNEEETPQLKSEKEQEKPKEDTETKRGRKATGQRKDRVIVMLDKDVIEVLDSFSISRSGTARAVILGCQEFMVNLEGEVKEDELVEKIKEKLS